MKWINLVRKREVKQHLETRRCNTICAHIFFSQRNKKYGLKEKFWY